MRISQHRRVCAFEQNDLRPFVPERAGNRGHQVWRPRDNAGPPATTSLAAVVSGTREQRRECADNIRGADYLIASHAPLPMAAAGARIDLVPVSYTHLRAHETPEHLVCRLL